MLPFCAYGFPLPVERYKKHLKTIPLFGGLSDTDAAAFSFVHENGKFYRINACANTLEPVILFINDDFPTFGIPKIIALIFLPTLPF